MGRRGPKKKLLAGNPGKRPLVVSSVASPAVVPADPNVPEGLSATAAAEWSRVRDCLAIAGRELSGLDRALLVSYCESWSVWLSMEFLLRKEGRIVKEPIQTSAGKIVGHRQRLHPAVRLQNEAATRMLAIAKEFGFSPLARDRGAAPAAGGPIIVGGGLLAGLIAEKAGSDG